MRGVRIDKGENACILLTKPDGGYRRYLLRYLLLTPSVNELVSTKPATQASLSKCDEVVVLEPSDEGEQMLQRAGFTLPHPPPVVVDRGR